MSLEWPKKKLEKISVMKRNKIRGIHVHMCIKIFCALIQILLLIEIFLLVTLFLEITSWTKFMNETDFEHSHVKYLQAWRFKHIKH